MLFRSNGYRGREMGIEKESNKSEKKWVEKERERAHVCIGGLVEENNKKLRKLII